MTTGQERRSSRFSLINHTPPTACKIIIIVMDIPVYHNFTLARAWEIANSDQKLLLLHEQRLRKGQLEYTAATISN